MVSDLRALLKRERMLGISVQNIQKFLTNYQPDRDEDQVSIRLQVLETAYLEFFEIRQQIELALEDVEEEKPDEDSKGKEAERRQQEYDRIVEKFDDRYCTMKAQLVKLQVKRERCPSGSREDQPTQQAGASLSRVKLPEIRLPTFDGRVEEWVTFRDSFKSLIHNSTQLTEIDKFTYLRSSLSGAALEEVNTVELTAANYPVAWEALEKRFENRKLIVKAHLDALFAVQSLRKESYDGLSRLIGEFEKNLKMLEKIGEVPAQWSTILAYMVCCRLDAATLRHWEAHHDSTEVPEYEKLMKFLRKQSSVLQSVAPSQASTADQRPSSSKSAERRFLKPSVCHTLVREPSRCPFCNESWHSAFQCGKFQSMNVPERIEVVTRSRLCRNCLHPGHFARFCERGTCRHCLQKHHSLLHAAPARSSVPQTQSRPRAQNPTPLQPQSKQRNSTQTQTHSDNTANSQNTNTQPENAHATNSQSCVALPVTPTQNILLSTALVRFVDRFGNSLLARALLDSCSQHCLMSKDFSKKLRFRETPSFLSIQGIGPSQSVSSKSVSALVGPRSQQISPFSAEIEFHVLPKLTVCLPTASVDTSEWHLPASEFLADPRFYETGPVDVIIGAEYYMELLKNERRKATDDGPTLQNTVFGWIVSGRVPNSFAAEQSSLVHVCSTAEIEDQLTKFWELETCRTTSIYSLEETACEAVFEKTTVRDNRGRFVVTLPKKDHILSRLGESKTTALRRFNGMELRFGRNPELKAQYMDFIHEYQKLGHMREVVNERTGGKAYYLPHHAVLKPDSTTTKLRVVFDASCRTSSGVCLNDALMVGPVVQDELLTIILRFRLHRYAVVADIAKMYRMVRVQESDQPLQRILWRDSPEEEVKIYELTTVTYGTASAPYLATKCLQRLAEEGKTTHPVAAKVVKQDFYVDDMLSGVDEISQGEQLVRETVSLLQSGGFSLRKWNSNSRELLLNVPEHLRDDRSILQLDSSSTTIKTLGLVWEPSTDNFRFSTPAWSSAAVITKRTVLSDVSRLFDPLGLVGPVIVQAKIFVQELWKQECGWDEPLNGDLQQQWAEYRRNLSGLEGLSVSRWVGARPNVESVELHGFCDASEKAYGACIYLRSVYEGGEMSVQLLASKSRVAPLENLKKGKKRQSIPRLELSSALLLAHLYDKIVRSLGIQAKTYFWTDSMIVKCWLASSPSRWKEFVANRVSEIQHLTKGWVWNHVAGVENPADIISRGMTPAQLQYQSLWFSGPHWLRLEEANWPEIQQFSEGEFEHGELEEKSITAVIPTHAPNEIFGLRSSLKKLQRITALILRFRFNAQAANRQIRREGFITVQEIDEALKTLVRLSQRETFPQELKDLTRDRPVRDSSRIVRLHPRLMDGLLCVGGRLQNANVSESRKHPWILDHRHPLAKLVVVQYHLDNYHAGQQQLTAIVREQFWPTNIRDLSRMVIHECVPCFRVKPTVQEQLMADLPPERVTPCSPFRRVGVDYCGPFLMKYPQRFTRPVKCYVAVFVCLVTKAVHLELVVDLTTQAFLSALKRFCSRRGKPDLIMCDNATNFVGARRKLDELRKLFLSQEFQEAVVREAANNRIEFRFIPARSPNFGGLWESAVKSFKTLFKRTIGTQILVFDDMQTTLAQIEAILNSRPLTPISNDPNDYEALTPGHFLIQRPLTAIPEPDLQEIPENRLAAWQQMEKFTQQLWQKWSQQYLSDLHNRTKWTKKRDNLAVGTMVVLRDEKTPPLQWPLARVTEVHVGGDGNVRVVTVKTKDGSFCRAVSKICVLPIRDNTHLAEGEN